ncbi:MAG: hypothetical protein JO257_11790 [Deltaproteobacteria bacterium]|nr:hypothetical protein [Deltaproteobacteria bacterium]
MRTLVLIGVLAVAVPARADVGLGLFVGEPTGLDLKIGISPRSGLDLVFGWDTYRDNRDQYGHVTYLATLLVGHGESVNVPLRLGVGAAFYGDRSFSNGTNVAVRVPLELGLRFRTAPVEIYGEIALKLTFVDANNDKDDVDLDGGIGFRIYF